MSPEWKGILSGAVLDASVRIALVAAMVALILVVSRIRSGGVRHAAWTAVLCAMLLMPVLPYCIPAIPIPIPASTAGIHAAFEVPEVLLPAQAALPGKDVTPAPASEILPVQSAAPGPAPRQWWPAAALTFYGAGALALLFRLLLGWGSTLRIARTSVPADLPAGIRQNLHPRRIRVYESARAVAPLTLGILYPRIILPAAWQEWPAEKLSAVLAHESAHVRRRDPLVGMLARLNRCIFWFHPLAWWLERKLAATAELACDDAAVRAIGETRRYAEILLDMAEAVRRSGGRFAWQGIGVHGGLLGQRIDRILRGDLLRDTSRTSKAAVALGCAAAIFLAVACRQQRGTAVPLQEDPKLAAEQAQQKARNEFYRAARGMNFRQVTELEEAVKKNPEDLASLEKLLVFYAPISVEVKGEKGKWAPVCAQVIGEKECVAARRPHILWLIEHHPDSRLAGDWGARIYPTSLDPLPDPAGYAEAKKLWLRETAAPSVAVQVLSNAAYFFEAADKPLAEQMLLRAQALDPKPHGSYALGRLYAFALVGSNSSTPLNVVRTVSRADASGPYAQEIRKKLADSKDAELLTAAGQYLAHVRERDIGFDPVAVGMSYLERALELNPQSVQARATLVSQRVGARNRRIFEVLRNVPKETQYQTVSALPESERFEFLPELAEMAYFEGENADYYNRDKTASQAAWDRAARYCQDAIALAPKFRGESYHGYAVYRANMILGTLALWKGDSKTAVRHLLEASKAPASEELAYYAAPAAERLVKYLLKGGEREPVIQFLEAMARTNVMQKDYLLESAAAIRRGQMPSWYQRTMMNQPDTGAQGR